MLDAQIFQFINNLAGQNIIIDNFLIFITIFGNLILFLVILFTWNKKLILKSIIAFITARAVDFGINLIYYRPRPFVVQEVNQLIAHKATAGFPSGHAITAFVFAQMLYFWNKKYGIAAYIFAFLIAFSRIYVGVHYPLDAIAGIIFGIGIAFIAEYLFEKYRLMKKFQKKWKLILKHL
jgi:undecaprenyl-diphosphatase